MTIVIKDSYLIAENGETILRFGGIRTAAGFTAKRSSAKDEKRPDRIIPDEEISSAVGEILESAEKSYINITFE